MPIYAYICPDCGFEKDQLQKLSDAPLTQCPSCSGGRFARKLTAPAFQLKGTGWYVTDFRDGKSARKPGDDAAADAGAAKSGDDKSAQSPNGESGTAQATAGDGKPAQSPAAGAQTGATAAGVSGAASAPAPAPAPAAGAAKSAGAAPQAS
jgi:putative FmdB family regulatory protein